MPGAPQQKLTSIGNPYNTINGSVGVQNTGRQVAVRGDEYGVQWVRNPLDPTMQIAATDGSTNQSLEISSYTWFRGFNISAADILAVDNAILTIQCFAGDAAVAWSANPIYFQVFNIVGLPVTGVTMPYFSWPVPPIPGVFSADFRRGWEYFDTGLSCAFSTTRTPYTTGPSGTVYLSYAGFRFG